ncbi:transglycosylase domain-containing protein [Branchiibius sp. NY16-3462-2]|uniref:transglycosylase domain-containing protein n=1 Tax=Branchiibius sp. NY16-3462-2 TaxID=1807500 RepID=UPI0025C587B5|nr:transglycosylase domain-containing protein [Branchiibius sp. NY16-3462-2]
MSDQSDVPADSATTTHGRPAKRPAGRPKQKQKKKHSLFFKVVVGTILGLFGLLLAVIAALVVIYFTTDIPKANADATKQISIAYYDDGKTEIGRLGSINRVPVTLDKVPVQTQHAFLAAEDRNFYENKGVSPTGILRALWSNVRGGGIKGGGSTITQQYVKNYFLTQDQSLSRKLREAMIAIKIDQRYSKDQILEDYLNNVYFGRGAYGIQAGAQAYFGVDSDKLTLNQGIFLASVINAPSLFDPAYADGNLARAQSRAAYVADGMVDKGWLTEAERANLTLPSFPVIKQKSSVSGPNGYIIQALRKEMINKLDMTDNDIDRGGLRIVTTINKKDQDAAIAAVNKVVPEDIRNLGNIHTGLMAQKPDGAVVAMYAGTDPQKEASTTQYQTMQGGSSFKVFGLAAALKQGMNPSTTYYNGPAELYVGGTGNGSVVHNFGNESFGRINLVTALAHSVNTVFVQLNKDLGDDYKPTLQAAQDLGIPATDPGMLGTKEPATFINNILGTPAVKVADMATAYNTINNNGTRVDQYFISKITSPDGDADYTHSQSGQDVLTKDQAATLTQAMSHVLSDRGATGATANDILDRPAAGKTGTSGTASESGAIWFTGFTPGQLTTSVSMFKPNNEGGTDGQIIYNGKPATGGALAAQVWGYFMKSALAGQPVAQLPNPSGDTGPTITRQPTYTSRQTQPTTTTSTPSSTVTSSAPPTPTSTTSTTTQAPTSTTTQAPTPTTTRSPSPTRTQEPTSTETQQPAPSSERPTASQSQEPKAPASSSAP